MRAKLLTGTALAGSLLLTTLVWGSAQAGSAPDLKNAVGSIHDSAIVLVHGGGGGGGGGGGHGGGGGGGAAFSGGGGGGGGHGGGWGGGGGGHAAFSGGGGGRLVVGGAVVVAIPARGGHPSAMARSGGNFTGRAYSGPRS
jgi:hypothetical protein